MATPTPHVGNNPHSTKRYRNSFGMPATRASSAGSASGYRPAASQRSASATPTSKPIRHVVFVGGFRRPLKRPPREFHSKALVGMISESQRKKVTTRFGYSAPRYHLDSSFARRHVLSVRSLNGPGPHHVDRSCLRSGARAGDQEGQAFGSQKGGEILLTSSRRSNSSSRAE